MSIGVHSWFLAALVAASPLDDRIAAFKEAPTQTEGAVADILKTGLAERRSALAIAAVKPWLNANPSDSQSLLFQAGQAAEFAGDWTAAASFYRKLLKMRQLNGQIGAKAVPAAYRLLINHLGDPEAAYLFMREEGARLREFGNARDFDQWFLERAVERNDLVALARWLAAIHNSDDALGPYDEALDRLLAELETFKHGGEALFGELDSVAAAKRTTAATKARIEWVKQIVPLAPEMAEKVGAKEAIHDESLNLPLQTAEALVNLLPYEGSVAVAKGWMHYNAGDSGVFSRFVDPRREEKAAPVIRALSRMSADEARSLLSLTVEEARGRRMAQYLLSPGELRNLVPALPEVFNTLLAPDVPLFDKTLTQEQAKALATGLARNPHLDAALVRAFAKDERRYSAVVDDMVKTELWRFGKIDDVAHQLWHSGMFDRGEGKFEEPLKAYKDLNAEYVKLRKQVGGKAASGERMTAFRLLQADLLSPAPKVAGSRPLWTELFANAPADDLVTMIKALTSNLEGEREVLLHEALAHAKFAKNGRLPWQAGIYDNHFRYHQEPTRKAAPELLKHLEGMVRAQMKAGEFSETIFGMWLHSVDVRTDEAIELIREIIASPAYTKLDPVYRAAAADSNHFGYIAMTGELAAKNPRKVSAELLALEEGADAAAVEAAFKAVMERAAQAPVPVAVLGLQPVAALPEWSAPTREMVLSLFAEQAPLGEYPYRQGYEQLIERLSKDLSEAGDWGAIEAYSAGLWHAAGAPDDNRHYRGAQFLADFAEAAQENGASSIAMTVARGGMNGRTGRALSTSSDGPPSEVAGRLRGVAGKAAVDIGAVEIPVEETAASYPIFKSNAEFVQGNVESAWSLYTEHADQLQPVLRELSVEYGFWLLERNTAAGRTDEAEELVKELTIWSREAAGTFSLEQEAQLKIAYADLAFRKGALPTSRAWYRKVAEAAEYEGSEMQLTAALGSVNVDRVSKNFSAALEELDKLMRLKNPGFRMRVRYARAEVMMDQENYADALGEVEAVLREEPKHPDALILRGKIQYEMRKLVEASEIELGPSQDDTVLVPGEAVKINLRDPTLSVSGVGADIEVEIWAKSGDKERVLLHQLGDSKEKFRAEVPTSLGPPTPGDKTLQILGEDEIRFGYSERFRAKMDDLPPDPEVVISVASDAHLAFSAGAFPPREGERRLDIEELGLSSAQAALGTRAVRPGNPVYLRITDADRSVTPGIDEIPVTLEASSGDVIRRLVLKETAPFSGEFEAVVPTTGAQALAFASESAPGRDPNMAISSLDYPGWQGEVGDKSTVRIFGVDLNDKVGLGKMTVDTGDGGESLTHFVLQTSMNGKDWETRARYPDDPAPWDGRPLVTSFPTFRGGIALSVPEDRELPEDWLEAMEIGSARESVAFLSATVPGLSVEEMPMVSTGHPGYSGLLKFRALFYQPEAAIRRFRLDGYPPTDKDGKINTIFLIDGEPAGEESENPMLIERELGPGLHEIEVWRHEGRNTLLERKPVLFCDEPGKDELVRCPDSMFDPASFPEGVRSQIAQPAKISSGTDGGLEVDFGDQAQARLVRMVIVGFKGVAPVIRKVTLSNRDGEMLLPVKQDYKALRENEQLEVLPGDQIVARYEDPVSATPKRTRHEGRLTVAFNNGTITASFLNYEVNREGERELVLEPIRRFRFDDAVGIVVEDADLDGSEKRDTIEVAVTTSEGETAKLVAVETEEHSGQFVGRIFPVEGEPSRSSEIKMVPGGTLTAVYRDMENLDPGIPADREVTIGHARYAVPALSAYAVTSEPLPPAPERKDEPKKEASKDKRSVGPEVVHPRRGLIYTHVPEDGLAGDPQEAVLGSPVRFDVVVPHLALAPSSEIRAYVQTEAARKEAGVTGSDFDVKVPGTLKLTGVLGSESIEAPQGYILDHPPVPPTNEPPLEEGRFSFSVPLILGDPPTRSFATKSAAELPDSAIPDGLAVKAGDIVHIGFPWQDEEENVHWKTTSFTVGSHAFLDVMENGFSEALTSAYVGEKVYLRLLAPGLDRGPDREIAEVTLKATSGATTSYQVRETEAHSGVFKGVFTISYADQDPPAELPPVELNGFPVRYGDDITVSYDEQSFEVTVNKGADGVIEPFTKRYTGDEMAVRTGFTLAECYFELAKKHREMEQESLARREIGHARKLLAEALASHNDPELKAHAEYLLGNLAQEYADLAKNEEAKLPMYQDALARFSKIPSDYPETEFASKAQFKTALVYEKMGEIENSVEEYVKLAYKYPDDELIPTVMSRLGGYFQAKGMASKKKADLYREKVDDESKAKVLEYDELSYPEFLNAAMVFSKLQERFPDDPLAGLAGLRAAQNYMRAHQYEEAIRGFAIVVANEEYDDREIRAQALYWSGLSHERWIGIMAEGNYKARGNSLNEAYQTYRRITFDFPDSKWAKYARGRLADPVFARIIELEAKERERMIEALKENR
ncbi:tetratricopeptide repeat protein [Haloferula helveola]|uniref:tetratricopeptide repeat protein n=1 Tax=Haloferula helveola TaxID=490095 RepID=UPI0030D0D4E5